MSDEVKTEPWWETDPAFAHIPITEEGVARCESASRCSTPARTRSGRSCGGGWGPST